jgi:hypothetical protein
MKRHPAWLAAALFLFVVLACNLGSLKNRNETSKNANESTAKSGIYVAELHMAKDNNGEPGDETETFSPGDRTIHCVAKLNSSKSGTKINFAWWVVEAEGSKNDKIKDIDYTTNALENVVHAHLTLPRDWPQGKYKCEVSVNGNLDKSVEYTVE